LITCDLNNSDHVFELFKNTSSIHYIMQQSSWIDFAENILRFLRFDDANARRQRSENNKAVPISEIWAMLNANLMNFYRLTENLWWTIISIQRRTRFTQYIPTKPVKYGISLVDLMQKVLIHCMESFILVNQLIAK